MSPSTKFHRSVLPIFHMRRQFAVLITIHSCDCFLSHLPWQQAIAKCAIDDLLTRDNVSVIIVKFAAAANAQ
jgi:hypothetical protein